MSSHSPDSWLVGFQCNQQHEIVIYWITPTIWNFKKLSHYFLEARVTSTLVASRQIDAVSMAAARPEMFTMTEKVILIMMTKHHTWATIFCVTFQPLKTLVDIVAGATKEGVASWTVAPVTGIFFS